LESWITDTPGPRTDQAPDPPPHPGDATTSALLPHAPAAEDELDDLIHIPAVQRLRTEVAVLRAQLFAAELIASERAERIADMRLVLAALRDIQPPIGAVRRPAEPVVVVPEPPPKEPARLVSPATAVPPAPQPDIGPGWIDWEPPGRTPEPDDADATDAWGPVAMAHEPTPPPERPTVAPAPGPAPNGEAEAAPRRRGWWRRRRP
jgi:hypothetical protein